MQVKFIVKVKGIAHYYPTMDEAVKMARFVGFPVSHIKEAHLW